MTIAPSPLSNSLGPYSTTITTTTTSTNEKYLELANGVLNLRTSFERYFLDEKDIKRIFQQLSRPSSPKRNRLKKRRRLHELESFVTMLSSACQIREVKLFVNKKIGDRGIQHLQLLPSTVLSLDLSFFNITPDRLESVCNFLETNKTIQKVNMHKSIFWMGEKGARHIGEMLTKNNTLREFRISTNKWALDKKGIDHLKIGFSKNKTLKKFGNFYGMDNETSKNLAFMLLEGNFALDQLYIELSIENSMTVQDFMQTEFLLLWEKVVKKCEFVKSLGECHCDFAYDGWGKIQFWLDLNKLEARKVIRDEDLNAFVFTLEKAANRNNLDAVFHMLQMNTVMRRKTCTQLARANLVEGLLNK